MEIVQGKISHGDLKSIQVFTYPSHSLHNLGKRIAEVFRYYHDGSGIRAMYIVDRAEMDHLDAMRHAHEYASAKKLRRIYEREI